MSELENLKKFAVSVVRGTWDVGSLDDADIQALAEKYGIIIETKYDPAIHGEHEFAHAGDPWFEFPDWLKSATAEVDPAEGAALKVDA
jgi:hypothetical protein